MRQARRYFRPTALAITGIATVVVCPFGRCQSPTVHPPDHPPLSGPGSPQVVSKAVLAEALRTGAQGYWLFLPADPVPKSAPVIVFCHGWGAMSPVAYRAWIDHLVHRGSIVVYPLYQDSLRTPPAEFLRNAVVAVKDALSSLNHDGESRVRPDTSRFAVIGHSAGGNIAAGIAATAAQSGLPACRALFAVQPGDSWGPPRMAIPLADLSAISGATLLLTLTGVDDHIAGSRDALRIYTESTQVPATNKNMLEMQSDDHGSPPLIANHFAPTSGVSGGDTSGAMVAMRARRTGGANTQENGHVDSIDALDWYGAWKLFDGLTDAAFDGRNRSFALGGGPNQLSMGEWSDGVPVKPLRVVH